MKINIGTEGAFVRPSHCSREDLVINSGHPRDEAYLTLDDLVELLPIIEQHLIDNGR